MIYRVNHVSRITYAAMIGNARFNVRLQPCHWPGQRIEGFGLTVSPSPRSLSTRAGPFPVNVTRVAIDEPLDRLEIRSQFIATVADARPEILPADPAIATVTAAATAFPGLGDTAPAHFLFPSPRVPALPEIAAWAAAYLTPGRPVLEAGFALCCAITDGFRYDSAATEADTPVGQAFAIRRGVCQDFAHILIGALRSAGLPAGYVSGYLRTLPPPGQPRLEGVDAMHAWVMLWCGPERGWIGLDPTNRCITGPDHIIIAFGRDYSDVAPIDGIFMGKTAQHLDTSVDVMPYTEWAAESAS
jgi:transglutaminase-like putative cysteine protease